MRLLSQMNKRPSVLLVRTLAHPWDTRCPALCRVRVEWESVLLDPQPSLLTLRRRAFRLCSNDSSVLCRCPTPRRRTCGPCSLSLLPPSCDSLLPHASARSPGSPASCFYASLVSTPTSHFAASRHIATIHAP